MKLVVCVFVIALCNFAFGQGNIRKEPAEYCPPLITSQPVDTEQLIDVDDETQIEKAVILNCEATGNPPPRYIWTKNGEPLNYTKYRRISRRDGNLSIFKPKSEDVGTYQCFATNKLGTATSKTITLKKIIKYDQIPMANLESLYVQSGNPLSLDCNPPKSWPKPKIRWVYKISAQDVPETNNDSRIFIDPNGSIHFSFVEIKDGHTKYSCVADYFGGEAFTIQEITLDVQDSISSELTEQLVSKTTEYGIRLDSIKLCCIYGGRPLPTVSWTKNGSNEVIGNNNILEIIKLDYKDEGYYTCKVESGNYRERHTIRLVVQERPTIWEPKDQDTSVGSNVEITCLNSGNPTPDVSWTFNGRRIERDSRIYAENDRLVINNVKLANAGNYGCNASNPLGYQFQDVVLYVNDEVKGIKAIPPKIVKEPSETVIPLVIHENIDAADAMITIECEATGSDDISYRWAKNGLPFDVTKVRRISQTPGKGTLTFKRPRVEDVGVYQCFPSNKWGTASTNTITVKKVDLLPFGSEGPKIIYGESGKPLAIRCHPPNSWPRVETDWFMGKNKEIKQIESDPRISVSPDGTLLFAYVLLTDGLYNYVCKAKISKNVFGGVRLLVVSSGNLPYLDPAPQYKSSGSEIAYRGKATSLYCVFSGLPVPIVTWKYNGSIIQMDNFKPKYISIKEYTKVLHISNVSLEHGGTYTCDVSNKFGTSVSYNIKLTIQAAPYFILEPEKVEKFVGDSATILCQVDGIPEPAIKWINNGKPLPMNPRWVVDDYILTISDLDPSDTGNYGCNASNSLGYAFKDVYINVLNKPVVPFFTSTKIIIIVLIVIFFTLVMTISFGTYKCIISKKKNKNNETKEGLLLDTCNIAPVHFDEWEVNPKRLNLRKLLGQGNFGVVYFAELVMDCGNGETKTDVAVKTLNSNATERDKIDLLEELCKMKHIGEHVNVVKFLGCCTAQMPILILMELMDTYLLGYLREAREHRYYEVPVGGTPKLTSQQLIKIALQVVRGMRHISSCQIVHRDLAARNVLINRDQRCKITDFGLSRYVDEDIQAYLEQSKRPMPVRWMAPETLRGRAVFSFKSDVWSFGILLWEIVTLGSTPYHELMTSEAIKMVCDGGRLSKPEHCLRKLYNVMWHCWTEDPVNRPDFQQLEDTLTELSLTFIDYIKLNEFPENKYVNVSHIEGELV